MKILVLGLNYSPELVGVGRYTGEFCRWLSSRGHDVQVVTAPPYYPKWKVESGYRRWWYQSESDHGVRVLRCPIWVPREPRPVSRMLHLLSFALSSALALIPSVRKRYDWVVVIVPTLVSVPAGLLIGRLTGARTWLHIQDFELGAAAGLNMAAGKRFWRMLNAVESWMMRKFDRVSTLSPPMDRQLQDRGISPSKRNLFPNWVDCGHVHPRVDTKAMREALALKSTDVMALYSGTINVKQHLDIVVDAAGRLKDVPGLKFVISGHGPARGNLEARARHLRNITWIDPLSDEMFPALLASADIHLLPQRSGIADQVLPSKLGGMLASGRPVVTTADHDSQVASVVNGRGLVVRPGDVEAFAAAIMQLCQRQEIRQEMGGAARQYAISQLDREAVLTEFEARLISRPTTGYD